MSAQHPKKHILERLKITAPISTGKSSAEFVYKYLGHKIDKWRLRGTPLARVYHTRCLNPGCSETLTQLYKMSGHQWHIVDGVWNEYHTWRMYFKNDFIDFVITPIDGKGTEISQSGSCSIPPEFRNFVLSLSADFFCERLKCLK